ncbi:MAG: radical SAM family heme chaperone HemW [Selenomonadaceae bacterium]|nr:radical SAM family heme chaperone HemW [Selenomonadaceae bacterium]
MRWGIYVHIPFCSRKCFYCDFPSYAGRERYMADYTKALCREIAAQGSLYRGRWGEPATIYIGGGTPTALPVEGMEEILCALGEISPAVDEFTVEANPGTVDKGYLELLRRHGVNRLSLGVQSFDDALLRRIGRIHTGEDAKCAVAMARAAGFQNISLDLIYALPGQSLEVLRESVETASALAVQHISIYGLQVEEGTVFARQRDMGKLELPGEDLEEAMYDYMVSELPKLGYVRYEISNFARAGQESRHNLGYWQDVPYLGLGAAAHSYLEGRRWENTAGIEEYIRCMERGESPAREEGERTREIVMEEVSFLALRTVEGINKEAFRQKFGCTLESIYGDVLRRLEGKGLLRDCGGNVCLTELGMKYGNLVFEEFLLA